MIVDSKMLLMCIGKELLLSRAMLEEDYSIDTSREFKFGGIRYKPRNFNEETGLLSCEILGVTWLTAPNTYKTRGPRYTENEVFLITKLIRAKKDFALWNGDSVKVDQSENLLTDIRNEYGERLLRIFNHIEPERISREIAKLKE